MVLFYSNKWFKNNRIKNRLRDQVNKTVFSNIILNVIYKIFFFTINLKNFLISENKMMKIYIKMLYNSRYL